MGGKYSDTAYTEEVKARDKQWNRNSKDRRAEFAFLIRWVSYHYSADLEADSRLEALRNAVLKRLISHNYQVCSVILTMDMGDEGKVTTVHHAFTTTFKPEYERRHANNPVLPWLDQTYRPKLVYNNPLGNRKEVDDLWLYFMASGRKITLEALKSLADSMPGVIVVFPACLHPSVTDEYSMDKIEHHLNKRKHIAFFPGNIPEEFTPGFEKLRMLLTFKLRTLMDDLIAAYNFVDNK